MARDLEDPADQLLASKIFRVRLPGEDELQLSARSLSYVEQAVNIRENQVRAFIGRGSAGKANRQRLRAQRTIGSLLDQREQAGLGLCVSPPNLISRYADGLPQHGRIVTPARQVLIV